MELNLRKARKLEAKILTYVNAMSSKNAVNLRVLSSQEERAAQLKAGREEFEKQYKLRTSLVEARFAIRDLIGSANHEVGINTLMSQREKLTAILAVVPQDTSALDLNEVEDSVKAKRVRLENGSENRYDDKVTIAASVATSEDVFILEGKVKALKRDLEDIEDKLSQKNVGCKIKLGESTVSLLKSVGLL